MAFDEQGDDPQNQRMLHANKIQRAMEKICGHLQVVMRWSQDIMEEEAHRSRNLSPNLYIRQKVWLDARNVRTTQPSSKLDWKQLESYIIIKQVSPYAYQLGLPGSTQIYEGQYVSLLDPVAADCLDGHQMPPHPSVEVEGDHE